MSAAKFTTAAEFMFAAEAIAAVAATGVGTLAASHVAARISTTIPVVRTSIPAAAVISAIPERCRASPVIPRAYADEHAIDKVIRSVIPVGRAIVRVGIVVSI